MDNLYTPPTSELSEEPKEWKRSKLLSFWLWFMLIMNVLNIPSMLFLKEQILAQTPRFNEAIVYSLVLGAAVSIACLIALMKNRKWGFWGLAVVTIYAFGVNYYGLGLKTALLGLSGFAILFALLHVGGNRKAWSRLS